MARSPDGRPPIVEARDEPTFRCYRCRDTGWVLRRCPDERCERRRPHRPHTFATRCVCWLTDRAPQLDVRRNELLASAEPLPPEMAALDELRRGEYRWSRPAPDM